MDTSKLKVYLKTALQQMIDNAGSFNGENGFTVILDNSNTEQEQYQDAPLFSGQTLAIRSPCDDMKGLQNAKQHVPEQIRRMKNLYQYGNGSFKQICKNFYVQGKFMENYEDNAPWNGELNSYYYVVTYHTLSLDALRGYFTWRTELRKGNYQRHCQAFTQIYLNELINGIGTSSAEESLCKMREFEKGYLDAGLGGFDTINLRDTLQRWMLEFAVLSGVAPEIARIYADSRMLEKDVGIEILRNPKKYSDQEVFNALCMFGGKKTAESKLIQQQGAEAIRLFAAVWRLVSVQYRKNRKTFFYLCFGDRKEQLWYPLAHTLYYNSKNKKQRDTIYELDPARSYRFTQGEWYISTYQSYYFNKQILADFLHEADRRLRLYLKAGYPLKERKGAVWAVPYIETVIEEDRKARLEATCPKITIDFSGLDKIRKDALEIQGSLLTEEETQGTPTAASNQTENAKNIGASECAEDTIPAASIPTPAAIPPTGSMPSAEDISVSVSVPSEVSVPLDGMQMQLLRMLLRGEPVQELIAAQHGMPSVIADAINEALFDLIGDTVVECDGETITLVEDYRDDLIGILG